MLLRGKIDFRFDKMKGVFHYDFNLFIIRKF